MVNESVIEKPDHRLLLSMSFLKKYPGLLSSENLFTPEAESTAENMLILIAGRISHSLPAGTA